MYARARACVHVSVYVCMPVYAAFRLYVPTCVHMCVCILCTCECLQLVSAWYMYVCGGGNGGGGVSLCLRAQARTLTRSNTQIHGCGHIYGVQRGVQLRGYGFPENLSYIVAGP